MQTPSENAQVLYDVSQRSSLRSSAGQASIAPWPAVAIFITSAMPARMRGSTWVSSPPPACASIWMRQVF